jgi:single-strand DNA-binding protein
MAKLHDVSATLGTYTDKDGNTKYISRNVGSIIETKNGPMLLLDASFNPAGCERGEDGKVWLKLFEPKSEPQF